MNRISTLVTVVLSFAVIGCAGIQSAQSHPQSASTVVESSSPTTLAQAQTDPLAPAQMRPNYQFTVQRQSGTCPKTVGLWMFMLGFEGGSDRTVVADTLAIASAPAKLVVSQPKLLEYEAPLRKEYASCVGQAKSENHRPYNFQFRDGKVRFRTDLTWADAYVLFLYKGVSASRPYIHWRVTE
jgi:hypothetical protein